MTKPWKVLNLPIEPIETRYSKQWGVWFEDAFRRNNIPFVTVLGEENHNLSPPPGKFLNPEGTFAWKYSQLLAALSACRDRSYRYVVFLHDGWMPGIEMFPYLQDLDNLDVKICSFWHAGAYDKTDLLGLADSGRWAFGSEKTWFHINNAILVGTEYHARKIHLVRGIPLRKIKVVGEPIAIPTQRIGSIKSPIVVWPHRISEDKHPEIFDRLRAEPCFTNVQFHRTRDQILSKEEYYNLLQLSKVAVSTASHENFGIAMIEAASMGCWPVCPDDLAYRETMEPQCLYGSYEELLAKVQEFLEKPLPYRYPHKERYQQEKVTNNICSILRSLGEEQ